MLTEKKALELIKKEKLQDNVIAHTMQVNKIANFLAKELKEKGENVNLELINVASLLHDIGRGRDHKTHVEIGTKLLKEMGEEEIAKVIAAHGLIRIQNFKNWEEKIVYYADGRVNHDKIVSLQERIDDIVTRYPKFEEKMTEYTLAAKEVEKEIFDLIGWDKENLELK